MKRKLLKPARLGLTGRSCVGKGACAPALRPSTISVRPHNLQSRSKEGRQECTASSSCATHAITAKAGRGQHVFYFVGYIAPLLRSLSENKTNQQGTSSVAAGSSLEVQSLRLHPNSPKRPRTVRLRLGLFLFMVKNTPKQN